MVRHATEAVSKTHKDADVIPDREASSPAGTDFIDATALPTCRPEHCFHAFDALYCALTHATPVEPLFSDDK